MNSRRHRAMIPIVVASTLNSQRVSDDFAPALRLLARRVLTRILSAVGAVSVRGRLALREGMVGTVVPRAIPVVMNGAGGLQASCQRGGHRENRDESKTHGILLTLCSARRRKKPGVTA